MPAPSSNPSRGEAGRVPGVTYWRVEGSLVEISALRSVGFFNWNSQNFLQRWIRRAGMAGLTLLRPPAYFTSRTFATRLLHGALRGITRDRMDLLGEEYFQYELRPRMRRDAVEKLADAVRSGERVVLVSQLLEHIVRPISEYFGAEGFIANRLEFRDGAATGRLCEPVIRPRGPLAWLASGSADGCIPREKLLSQLGWKSTPELLESSVQPKPRPKLPARSVVERLGSTPEVRHLRVREALAGKHLLLVGVTGFIGKVWMVDLLEKIPEIAKITLLIRRNRTTSAQKRFEKIVEESPTLDRLQEIHGA
ncbi:MAG TPA: haloacid dehalogenase-like hydrolase, partial [Dongiaceae bacterium]|nr:haloacid dehalogenase-like hydrolase [Dongiaceae bacterium]